MENLDSAYISIENKRAYFCSLDIEWLTFFDECTIETINELNVFTKDFEIKDSSELHESILNQHFDLFTKKVELEHQEDIVFFDFKLDKGVSINFQTVEVSMSFENLDKLIEICKAILRKANYSEEETFQKLVDINFYCSIEAPNHVTSFNQSSNGEYDLF